MSKMTWTIKNIKRRGKSTLKRNYIVSVIVCIIVAILVGTHPFINSQYELESFNVSEDILGSPRVDRYSNSRTVEIYTKTIYSDSNPIYVYLHKKTDTYADGVLSSLARNTAQTGSIIFGIMNALNQFIFEDSVSAGVIIFVGVFLLLLYYLIAGAILGTGEKRFFLESRTYRNTPLSRLFFLIKIRKIKNPLIVTAMRYLFNFLWFLTIIGGFIKIYSYRMVPFILAENPEIHWREALDVSKKMMKGNKWRSFLLDLTFIPWYFISLFTFGILGVLFINPYREAALAEQYIVLRKHYLDNPSQITYCFNDIYLDAENDLDQYPTELYHIMEKPHRLFGLEYKKKYSATNLILLFFSFSVFGWVWEVIVTFFQMGEFFNRGFLWGPWLPIYGTGGVLLLLLLKPLKSRPFITFLCAMVICGTIEYFTAWYLETIKHMSYWNYSGYLLNLDGRICLEGLLVFGLGGLGFIYFLAPLIDSFLIKIPINIRRTICVVLIGLFLTDFTYSSIDPNTGRGISKKV